MKRRVDYKIRAPEGIKAMWGLESYVRHCGLEHSLLELVKTRASQINGCAFCLDMHTKDARAQGETEERLHTLSAWHRRRSSPTANGRRLHGQKPPRASPTPM